MFDTLREAARIASWAPDEARELIASAGEERTANIDVRADGDHRERSDGGGDVDVDDAIALARAGELLARVGAITGEWDMAKAMYAAAAESWEPLDTARAQVLRAIGEQLPLAELGSDVDALAHELELVRRIFDAQKPAPVVLRALVELRRARSPEVITAIIERTFRLSPGEMAYVMAVAAPGLEVDCAPRLPVADWQPLLGSSSLDGPCAPGRALSLGLVRVSPTGELVPHPALVSRLLGRATLEQPIGITLRAVTPAAPPPSAEVYAHALVLGGGIGIGPDLGELAAIAALRGFGVMLAQPDAAASRLGLASAIIEAGLHGALVAIDLDTWPDVPLPDGPLLATARRDTRIPPQQRAFTLPER